MLNIRMNEMAVESLGPSGAVPSAELTPGLRKMVAEGIVRHGAAVGFARDAARVRTPRPGEPDLTRWECSTSSVHLEDVVPVRAGAAADGERLIGEADQVSMLRQGLGFALEVVRLARALPEPAAVRCVVGANSTNGTFRFHCARPGETRLDPDVDTYLLGKLILVDSGPVSLGGTPW
ncbi:hypothetical protein ACWEOE_22255 [Amycolatopsis sp. NPDC004368]